MYYISYEDQLRIKRRMKRLPNYMKRQEATIMVFETVSTLILAYGVCISIFKHPIKDGVPDPACDIFIACFYYFALSVSAPFTGGHMNPATTIAFNFLKKNTKMPFYFAAQFLGATIAAILAYFFFSVVPAPYVKQQDFWSCVLDTIGQAIGLFIVIFVALIVTQTRYASSEYFGYMVISFSVMAGRAFTFRKGCINPALGTVFQVVYAIWKQQYILILYSIPVIVGPTVGAIAAYYLFTKFYKQLIQEVKEANEFREVMEGP